MPKWVLHDIRRTVASGMARLGINIAVVEKLLNHVSGSFAGIVGVYQRHSFADEKRAAMATWAAGVASMLGRSTIGNLMGFLVGKNFLEPLLAARRVLREKFAKLHRKVLLLARDNEVCQRLMTIPGVGPVVSLAFISTVDVPARFRNSKAVGPSLGLTPVLNQSGESHRVGRTSLCGDEAR
jgi:Transposase IS116/IS110/IS902 family